MKTNDILNLLETGIPVSKAEFIYAVDTIHNMSEKRLDIASNLASRRAEMYFTPVGLLCIQLDQAFIVPLANVICAK